MFPQVANLLANKDKILYLLQDEENPDIVTVIFEAAADVPIDKNVTGIIVFEGEEAREAWRVFGGKEVKMKSGDQVSEDSEPGKWKEEE